MFIGPYVIQKLREFQIGQYIHAETEAAVAPEKIGHADDGRRPRSSSPSCCGDWCRRSDPANPFVWIAVCSTLAYAAIGFADDYTKVVHRRNLGLTARAKLFWQALAGASVGVILVILTQFKLFSTQLSVPFLKFFHPGLQWHHWPATLPHLPDFWPSLPFVAFVIFVLMSTSNAVNLTDGLDGLAIGCTIIAAGALTVLTYVSGHVVFADYLELQRMPLVAELTVFCGSMVGASIGFLWYNAHPAEVFMGDVGSLALGGAIGTVAVIIRQEFLLPFIGGIFVLEAVSVVLQVGSYKLRKKRIFKMAPLHHHFEQLGWSESKVIARFWILALVFALFALTTLKLR